MMIHHAGWGMRAARIASCRLLVATAGALLFLAVARGSAASMPGAQDDPFKGFGDIISRAASQAAVDPNLIAAIIKQSSDFNPLAGDAAGASGLMLIAPETAKAYGVTNPYDPQQNVAAGARFLAALLTRYGGDVSRAVAAYNVGPGVADRYPGVPPLPETERFVRQVLRYRDEFAGSGQGGAEPSDLSRWAGVWGAGAYEMTISVSGNSLSGTFKAEFNDGNPKHKDTGGKMSNMKRIEEELVGDWESAYSDSEKSGRRWGTFKIRLEPGASRADDRVVGDWVEKGDEMAKANPGTAMYPGRVWPVDWRRRR